MALFEPIIVALNDAGVRYVVVGGVAVVLHGHARFTADLDLAVDLAPDEARKAVEALVGLGLRPTAPVDPVGFADESVREGWFADRGMLVFSLRDPDDPMRQVDLFTRSPLPFEELWSRSTQVDLEGTSVRVASLEDLITMKRASGRPLDLDDVEVLEAIPAAKERGVTGGRRELDPAAERAAWQAHRRERLLAVADATPAQRLAWLEEAIAFARRAGALPREEQHADGEGD